MAEDVQEAGSSEPRKPPPRNRPPPKKKQQPKTKADVYTPPFASPTPVYYEDAGLRKLVPYMFSYNSWAKSRWRDRSLIDVYGTEFRDRSEEYYIWAMKTGLVLINGKKVEPNYIVRNGDLVTNCLHRHEPPVVRGPVRILYDGRLPGNDGSTLVVSKPGSMPVHPTGRYNFNTLLEVLKYDYGLPLVHTCNRLDRLTSGLMVCTLTVEASQRLGGFFNRGEVEKEYVARVSGEFPAEVLEVNQPLLTIDRQIGVNVVHPDGRPARTIFKRLSYDADSRTSVVHCTPVTGRSHQIRVHLQWLGHPIANDPVYQNVAAWGEQSGKGGIFDMPGEDGEDGQGLGREATEEEQSKARWRRRMGELEMAAAALVLSEEAPPAPEGESASIASDKLYKYNKRGQVSVPLPGAVEVAPGQAGLEDRAAHDVPLNKKAEDVIRALRDKRDEEDGWSRWRDLKGVELAQEARGGRDLTLDDISGTTSGENGGPTVVAAPIKAKVSRTGHPDEPDDFCPTCFVPLVADPAPHQLYIFLHCLRNKTSAFDYVDELPPWAAESWPASQEGKAALDLLPGDATAAEGSKHRAEEFN